MRKEYIKKRASSLLAMILIYTLIFRMYMPPSESYADTPTVVKKYHLDMNIYVTEKSKLGKENVPYTASLGVKSYMGNANLGNAVPANANNTSFSIYGIPFDKANRIVSSTGANIPNVPNDLTV